MSSRLILGAAVLLVVGVAAATVLPTWMMLLLGSLALAVL
jgi:hypothetical protein